MAQRKLKLEIQRSVEHEECGNQTTRWHGQHAIATSDITGSVTKILIRDSEGKLITITIGENGTIREINESNGTWINSTNLKNQTDTNSEENMPPPTDVNQRGTIDSEKSLEYACNIDLEIVKKEAEEYLDEMREETAVECSTSFEKVLGIISEGYNNGETLERELEEEFYSEMEEIKFEETSLAGQFETVYIDSATTSENYDTIRSEQNLEASELIFESTNPTTMPFHCRLCANRRKDMVHIFGGNEACQNIVDKIADCLPITVRKTDALPKQVCQFCLAKLESFYKFYKTVEEAEKQLLMLAEKISEESRNAEQYPESSTPCNGEQAGIKPAEVLGSDEKKSGYKLSSIPVTKSLKPLNGEEKISGNNNADDDVIFVGEAAIDQTFATEIGDIVKCRLCGQYFGSVRNCYVHSGTHATENNFPCSMCDKTFDNKQDGYKHSLLHSVGQTFVGKAAGCNMKFTQKARVLNSAETTTEEDNPDDDLQNQTSASQTNCENKVKCRLCGVIFGSAKSCYSHSNIHASKNNYPCSMCDKTLTSGSEGYLHSLEHQVGSMYYIKEAKGESSVDQIGADMVKCRICGKFFGTAKSCYMHSRIHASERNYPCCICEKTFTNEEDCYMHSLEHKMRKILQTVTDQGSSPITRSRGLSDVTDKISEKDKTGGNIIGDEDAAKKQTDSFECRICSMSFRTAKSCYLHSTVCASENNYPCNVCNKTFITAKDCYLHYLEHEFCKTGQIRPSNPEKKETRNNLGSPPIRGKDRPRRKRLSNITEELSDQDNPWDDIPCDEEAADDKNSSDRIDTEGMIKRRICEVASQNANSCYCKTCEKTMSSEESLCRHMLDIHGNAKKYKCKICGEKSRNQSHLDAHQGKHKKRGFECSFCKKRFGTNNELVSHKVHNCRSPLNAKRFSCTYCGKTFLRQSCLTDHLRNHTSELPFGCNFCAKRFPSNRSRNTHLMSHEDIRRFKCTTCKMRFFAKSGLKEHERLHSSKEVYKCSSCNESLNSENTKNDHVSAVHRHQCYVCDKYFDRRSFMIMHKRTQHGLILE